MQLLASLVLSYLRWCPWPGKLSLTLLVFSIVQERRGNIFEYEKCCHNKREITFFDLYITWNRLSHEMNDSNPYWHIRVNYIRWSRQSQTKYIDYAVIENGLKKVPYSGNLESKLLPMDVQLSYEEKLSGLGDKLNMILIKVHVNTQLIHYLKSDKYIYNSYFINWICIQ